jgi:alkylation response protein AidB-like acyl-CoA dehydrogenase
MGHADSAIRAALPLSQAMQFSDEQSLLLETATAFCRDKSPIATVRQRMTTDAGFDRAVWDEMVALGWSGMAIPESFGGSGLTLAELATVTEPIGRHLLATPLFSTQLFVQAVLAGANPAQQALWLPKLVSGAIGTVALFEQDGDWALDAIAASARNEGNSVVLAGDKILVGDALQADCFAVSVMLDGAPALVIVPAADIGAARMRRETIIDETRRSAALSLDGIRVPGSALITGEAARKALEAVRHAGLLLASAEVGGIAGVLGVVLEYLNLRKTFGRKIGSYQSLKHTCADILIGLERSRSHVYHAASLITEAAAGADISAIDIDVALRMAKVETGDSFVFAGDRAVQFHGGFGFTWECDAQLYLRRALWLQYAFGDAGHHRRKLADALLSPVG